MSEKNDTPSLTTKIERATWDCTRCILSKPDAEVTVAGVANCTGFARDSVRTYINRFSQAGYLTRSEAGEKGVYRYSVAPGRISPAQNPDCNMAEVKPRQVNLRRLTSSQRLALGCVGCRLETDGSLPLKALNAGLRECRERPLTTIRNVLVLALQAQWLQTPSGYYYDAELPCEMTEKGAEIILNMPRDNCWRERNAVAFMPEEASAVEPWHVERLQRVFSEEEGLRVLNNLRLLYDKGLLQNATITREPKLPFSHWQAQAIANKSFDPHTLRYTAMGPALYTLASADQKALLHVLGADIFIYGKRLDPSILRADLQLPSNMTLGQYVQKLLSTLRNV